VVKVVDEKRGTMMGIEKWSTMCLCMTTALLIVVQNANGFLPTSTTTLSSPSRIVLPLTSTSTSTTTFGRHLVAVEAEKKKRRRKEPPSEAAAPPQKSEAVAAAPQVVEVVVVKPIPEPTPAAVVVIPVVAEPMSSSSAQKTEEESFKSILLDAKDFDDDAASTESTTTSLSDLFQVAKFKFVPDNDITKGVKDDETVASSSEMMMPGEEGSIPLPDIKQVLRRKEIEKELERMEEERESQKVKINRKDKKAMARVSSIVAVVEVEVEGRESGSSFSENDMKTGNARETIDSTLSLFCIACFFVNNATDASL
jgi:hypothetical protein